MLQLKKSDDLDGLELNVQKLVELLLSAGLQNARPYLRGKEHPILEFVPLRGNTTEIAPEIRPRTTLPKTDAQLRKH